jgi:hypothetical protein
MLSRNLRNPALVHQDGAINLQFCADNQVLLCHDCIEMLLKTHFRYSA